VEAFADLAPEMRQRVAALARVEVLAGDEEVAGFGGALVIEGDATVRATIDDTDLSPAARGALVTIRGTAAESVALRVVAGAAGARVAVWDGAAIEDALRDCPWVLEELAERADRLQAMAGATMGPLGELDDAARRALLDKLRVRAVKPAEPFVAAGAELDAVTLVCVGAMEVEDGDEPRLVRSGELLFANAGKNGDPAPSPARASTSGALLLVGDRALVEEILRIPELAAQF
jgi:hypothetical protein